MDVVWLVVAGIIVGALGTIARPMPGMAGLLVALAVGVAGVVGVGLLTDGWGFWGDVLAVGAGALLVLAAGRLEQRRRTA